MREWQGDHSDRKGKLLFRQAQQTARQVGLRAVSHCSAAEVFSAVCLRIYGTQRVLHKQFDASA